jgi:hypothetical protein
MPSPLPRRRLGLAASLLLASCSHHHSLGPLPTPFSGEAAYARLADLLHHPRAPGHPTRAQSIEHLADMLRAGGAQSIDRMPFTAFDPWSEQELGLTNLIGWVRPDAERLFVLATHFDTPPRAHEDVDPQRRSLPVPGANDGTSGVAVVLELMPMLAQFLAPDVGFAVILFDGEEVGAPGRGGYSMGSRHLADRLQQGEHGNLRRAELGVVLDMVGDRDLRVLLDPDSRRFHPEFQEHLWRTAGDRGATGFVSTPGPNVSDDHVFLSEAGIPSVLILDSDFPAWHTTADDLSQVSPESLAEVGEVVRVALLRWFWPV